MDDGMILNIAYKTLVIFGMGVIIIIIERWIFINLETINNRIWILTSSLECLGMTSLCNLEVM